MKATWATVCAGILVVMVVSPILQNLERLLLMAIILIVELFLVFRPDLPSISTDQ